ncbi:antitoxin VbhA family protein [Aurantimonas sp. C2-6-R+9]|uniref:antitoxin VbhA family protein n=1 Tax=unclassified Aurantimonas TaxID=2638230 RepID=UPI002E194A0E|nr:MULTISPECIES: antitoxin VbhA family protein [unclassified Aurantimonas]MEC5292953.1 antitoxin VbhA family protein [Aurantimonas sp. C2-3-R2]MEC5383238.1 antitoxin VbhA family protein [Aurantimonas sp. C2-6-R+9]MEC5413978.1 antitoxin VbhA family protein [Aurantimonas sp. C2-4-R8]
MSVATNSKGAAARPAKTPEAIASRRETVRQAHHSCAMEGLTRIDPETAWIEEAFIEGNMTTIKMRKAILAHYTVK